MRRITFKELVAELQKDVEKYGDVLVKNFEIVGEYNELEEAIWDYESLEETYKNEKYILTKFGKAIKCKIPPIDGAYIDTWNHYDIYKDNKNNIYAVAR